MRIFAVSDIHVDYEENQVWLQNLSRAEYQNDILIVAGDITDKLPLFGESLRNLRERFYEVFYIPGNHDLWVRRTRVKDSLEKFRSISEIAADCGVRMEPFHVSSVSIIPLYGWYDFSFGRPSPELLDSWTDYIANLWPDGFDEDRITRYFTAMNEPFIAAIDPNRFVITFSHFLPRIDIMPSFIPVERRTLYPVLGTSLLEDQIRRSGSRIHVYGHSHVNQKIVKENILYINNAYGYPHETHITAKELLCVYEVG